MHSTSTSSDSLAGEQQQQRKSRNRRNEEKQMNDMKLLLADARISIIFDSETACAWHEQDCRRPPQTLTALLLSLCASCAILFEHIPVTASHISLHLCATTTIGHEASSHHPSPVYEKHSQLGNYPAVSCLVFPSHITTTINPIALRRLPAVALAVICMLAVAVAAKQHRLQKKLEYKQLSQQSEEERKSQALQVNVSVVASHLLSFSRMFRVAEHNYPTLTSCALDVNIKLSENGRNAHVNEKRRECGVGDDFGRTVGKS
ncbi:unnamed protein product [Ceratitis capitata]|uniref:(Mediterranean fruit fly) hypothetical protein n=1 Tax=Ceratitis capitata TaxID=7213 RepID=A0A811V660_CERCA|nr:unnamed protein product [Ceratitis capitata]